MRCTVYDSRFQADNDRILAEYSRLHAVSFDRGVEVQWMHEISYWSSLLIQKYSNRITAGLNYLCFRNDSA